MRARRFARGRKLGFAIACAAALALVGALLAGANVSLTVLNTDSFTNTTSQHKTEVEPDSFSFGSTIVSAAQVGRFSDGGASNIGFATSTNGGSSWTNGFLPGLTVFSSPAGSYDRATDPAVAFDAAHNVWLINSLGLVGSSVSGAAVVVNRSTDGGLTWNNAITVRSASGRQDFDKNWIVCDDTSTSPFYGRCYVEYDDFGNGNALHMEYSTNGGLTWTAASVPNAGVIGAQPVVQPNGTVVVPTDNANETALGATVSTNGGVSYSAITTITTISDHSVAGGLRSSPLPSAEVDGSGTVYVVWQDCRFRKGCKSNDIVMTTSTNGTTWTPVVRVPVGTTNDKEDNFIPGIAVDKSTSGATARLAIAYYFYPDAGCNAGSARKACQLDVGYISSATGGASWSASTQLAGPMALSWLPNTTQGRMVGDYISTSFNSGGLAHGFFALAQPPTAGGSDCATATPNCDQALYTTVAGLSLLSGVVVTSSGDHPVPNAASDHAVPASRITVR
jgi:BNR repeat protein